MLRLWKHLGIRLRRDLLILGLGQPARHALRRGVAAAVLRHGARAVLRIPGNTACEIQFCEVDGVTSSYTETVYHASTTGSGTATRAPAPSVTEGATIGPPEKLENCMRFVYEGDLPDGISDRISYASSWSVVRFYDDELPPDEVRAAVLASPAPPSWTSAAADPFDKWLSGSSAPTATPGLPQTTPSSSSSRGIRYPTLTGLEVLAIAAISMIGFVAF
ncbi:hypothetical protein EKO27_g8200 [Xylaria grammica]|uniref:Uncharacterized protein n=1 Tax=Xylaria grammica TaxID=363999 RepID=A0A439CXZ4_9PEZI|nr:hypothetical protein EKO27_g8200 [Xylaria grammica]